MDLKQNTIPEVAEIRHLNFLGKPYDVRDEDIKTGFVIGYQQAIEDIVNTMNLDREDIRKAITKLYGN